MEFEPIVFVDQSNPLNGDAGAPRLVVSGATVPQFAGLSIASASIASRHKINGTVSSLSDLPSSITLSALGTSSQMRYFALLP